MSVFSFNTAGEWAHLSPLRTPWHTLCRDATRRDRYFVSGRTKHGELFYLFSSTRESRGVGKGRGGLGELGVFFYFTFLAWGRSRAVSSGSCAWLPFHRVSVLQPAERNVLILVRSRAFAYYLCPNAARLGNGAEIHHFLGTDVVFFLFFFP